VIADLIIVGFLIFFVMSLGLFWITNDHIDRDRKIITTKQDAIIKTQNMIIAKQDAIAKKLISIKYR